MPWALTGPLRSKRDSLWPYWNEGAAQVLDNLQLDLSSRLAPLAIQQPHVDHPDSQCP